MKNLLVGLGAIAVPVVLGGGFMYLAEHDIVLFKGIAIALVVAAIGGFAYGIGAIIRGEWH